MSKTRHTHVSWIFLLISTATCILYMLTSLCEVKVLNLAGVAVTGGFFIIPLTYILNDCLVEVYGYDKARTVLWITLITNIFVIGILQLMCVAPSASYWDGAEHFNYVFNQTPRIAFAALLTYLCATTTNAIVMAKMKARCKFLGFKFRAMVSTVAGESVDALVFYPVVFAGILPWTEIFFMILCTTIGKCCWEALLLPLTSRFVEWVKSVDDIDVSEVIVSYNPFKFSRIW